MSSPGWEMDYPDPADFFEALFSSEAINEEQSTNYAFFRNREVDDPPSREGGTSKTRTPDSALYSRANHIVCDEAPWAFTFSTRFYDVVAAVPSAGSRRTRCGASTSATRGLITRGDAARERSSREAG